MTACCSIPARPHLADVYVPDPWIGALPDVVRAMSTHGLVTVRSAALRPAADGAPTSGPAPLTGHRPDPGTSPGPGSGHPSP